jgi:F420H(2)-dependent quinone reductase
MKKEKDMTVETTIPGPPEPSRFAVSVLNAVFVMILRSPLHGMLSKSFALLSFKGRKSGKQYTLVIGYQRDGDVLTIISPRGWWKNLREGNVPVRVFLHGKWCNAVAEAFQGGEIAANAFQRAAQKSPSLIRMYRIEQDADGQLKPESLRLATRKVAVIHVRLSPEQ